MKKLFPFLKLNTKKCPYCQYKFEETPKEARNCPSCGNEIYLQKEGKQVILITEEEKTEKDIFEKIKVIGFTWEEYILHKKDFSQKTGNETINSDFPWLFYEYLLNEKAKAEDFMAMEFLYELMAEMVKDDKTKHLSLKKQANSMKLYHDKQNIGSDGFVEVICSDEACESCKELSKNKIPIKEAVKNAPLPNENCTNQECNCTLVSKPREDYVVDGILLLNSSDYQYKHYNFYLSKWHKYDGDYVKKGEKLFTLELTDSVGKLYGDAVFDGFLEIIWYASPWARIKKMLPGKKIYAIHKNPDQSKIQELKDKRFENIPLVKTDDFTGNKEIKWKSINGKDKLYHDCEVRYWWSNDCFELGYNILFFTFNNLNSKDYIVFRYLPKEYNISKGSKISFLFENNEIIDFLIKDKPYEFDKVYVDNRKVRLNEVKVLLKPYDLEAFKHKELLKWKIEVGKSGRVIEDTIGSSNLKGSIKKFANEYHEIVQKEIEGATPGESVIKPATSLSNLPDYSFPPTNILKNYEDHDIETVNQQLEANKQLILRTLKDFEIEIDKIEAIIGPTVTLYELTPARGMRLSKIKNLEDDITLALSALGIRITAPLPGKGTVGIEVPNTKPSIVSLKSVVECDEFINSDFDLPLALGKTIDNKPYIVDLNKMPHILMAGATGQGKSVGLNVIISSLLYKKRPSEVKFILVDPKKVEFSVFNALKDHFLIKFVKNGKYILTETEEIIETLNSLCNEMDNRFNLLQDAKVKNIKEYNGKIANNELTDSEINHVFMPYIVLVIDEFADLMLGGTNEVEKPITRLAQLARAVGIHLIIATQRPSVNIITGLIKANFPARIAYRVSSRVDSRTILDSSGAEKLIGRGDMLFSEGAEFVRLQCPFISTEEIENIVSFINSQKAE